VLKNQGFAQKMIAEQIGKNASVVCRELQRNCDNRSGEYKAELAEKKCRNRHKIKSKKILSHLIFRFWLNV
jgi:IS30 family transposase